MERNDEHDGQGDATTVGAVQHPVLVVNGDDDVTVPSFNSFELARRLPKAQLSITSLRPRASELQRIEQVYHVRLLLVDNPHLVLDRFVRREESTEVVLRR
jgi:pimeloyl-ACP methyl ester carboxylesterase